MANAVSHEIKTPLSRMQFAIELAQRAESVAAIKPYLADLRTDITAIDSLVAATLEYAILERADIALNFNQHDFTALLPAIVDDVRRDVTTDIQIKVAVQSDAGRVICDGRLIEAVLKNLLYNAVRYARHEVRVTFKASRAMNELTVCDDGPGIAPQDRQRVFDSFVQLESSANTKGFGLGLAIVKRASEWHGGSVSVGESPDGGASFLVAWPLAPPKR
jgi:two-component system, OmpR family, sensor kinase